MGGTPKPNLVKTTALSKAQGLFSRINSLLPSYSTPISPSTVYQPLPAALATLPNTGAVVGNALLANYPSTTYTTTNALWGVWIAPNINNGADYTVQVECFAGGGGGGGGNMTAGGGGGQGGEYACEPVYSVTPGLPYIWIRGLGGQGGFANTNNQTIEAGDGFNGGDTIFDLASTGIPGGVHAHGGIPGDATGAGIGGTPTPTSPVSTNTIVSEGGVGGTNNSNVASDNPQTFAANSSLWTVPPTPIECWLPMDDSSGNLTSIQNAQNSNANASVVDLQGSVLASTAPAVSAAPQVPTQNSSSTQYGGCVQFKYGTVTSPAGAIGCSSFPFSGPSLMISAWVQCDPSGVWGSPSNQYATVAANCAYPNGNVAGMALCFKNTGSSGVPVWQLSLYCCKNGSTAHTLISAPAAATPPTRGVWYYVVGVFNAGAMTLYVNGVSQATGTHSATLLNGGIYPMAIGLRPDASTGQFFGYTSNFWFAQGVPTTTLISQAYGSGPLPTGGAGGGASGGASTGSSPFTNGGAGSSAAGANGGAGGVAPTQSAAVSNVTTPGQTGGSGSHANSSNSGSLTTQGSGGGGSGTSASLLAPQTITAAITTAASYNGIDGSNPYALYNPNQQGTSSTLIAGGQASDPTTGSKNAILLLPPGLQAQLTGKTIVDCYLTVYNANPTNTITPILEINYSSDTTLPTNYSASVAYEVGGMTPVVPYLLQGETTAQQISLMNTGFTTALQANVNPATAIVIGPGGTLTTAPNNLLDAYNAPAANYFYTSIYGPGATDSFGNSLEPVLTVIYTTGTPQQGETGGPGYIAVTSINNEGVPVATMEPYQTTDADGNTFAAGFTGQITAFAPGTVPYTPETWHALSLQGAWTRVSGYHATYRLTATGDLELSGRIQTTGTNNLIAVLPAGSGYYQATSPFLASPCSLISGGTITANQSPRIAVDTSGNLTTGGISFAGTTVVSLDGVIIPLSAG
jgi:hypothetical protein